MSNVVVGLMTCDRFLPTRGAALRDTWLSRARRVLYFSDDAFASDGGRGHSYRVRSSHSRTLARRLLGGPRREPPAFGAPLVRHAFAPTRPGETVPERIYSGGNWRAVPILRSVAEAFFTADAATRLAAQGEPAAEWAFLADDDSFVITSQLTATPSRYLAWRVHCLAPTRAL